MLIYNLVWEHEKCLVHNRKIQYNQGVTRTDNPFVRSSSHFPLDHVGGGENLSNTVLYLAQKTYRR